MFYPENTFLFPLVSLQTGSQVRSFSCQGRSESKRKLDPIGPQALTSLRVQPTAFTRGKCPMEKKQMGILYRSMSAGCELSSGTWYFPLFRGPGASSGLFPPLVPDAGCTPLIWVCLKIGKHVATGGLVAFPVKPEKATNSTKNEPNTSLVWLSFL